jgi:hypothetical protein
MPANATTLSYTPLINVDLSDNEVNLTSSSSAGHRISVNVGASAMNSVFIWSRSVGDERPTGTYNIGGSGQLMNAIINGLDGTITDADGNPDGLDFSTTAPEDSRVTALLGADRLVASYILYKGYGKSSFDTSGVVFNVEDLSGMTSSSAVMSAITGSFSLVSPGTNVNPDVNKMFQDLIAADPTRFFDASGLQIGGIFETNTDIAGSGNWNFAANDKVEVKLTFTFAADVSVYDADGAAKMVIKSGESFPIRLQLTAV